MEAIRKQASKLREQVAKQQQAVLRQFSVNYSNDPVIADEAELQCYQQLQGLYNSTRAAKRFQRDLVRGVEGLISISSKQMEITTKLADDCCKYGNENQCALAKAALLFGTSHSSIERERENLLDVLGDQVSEPLRAMIMGAPLEDARHLTRRYDRIRQEAEAQAAEVKRRQMKSKEAGATAESEIKLQNAETKLSELRSTTSALGREATAAMMSVEAQQQRITFQRLLAMVDAERSYHQSAFAILDKLHTEIILEKPGSEPASLSATTVIDDAPPKQKPQSESASLSTTTVTDDAPQPEDTNSNESDDLVAATPNAMHFIAKVIHPFDAQTDSELALSVGDYIVVRQVTPDGWSEGECKGKAGWFPSAYIEQRDKAPASKVMKAILPSS
eukprot:TRINITY_DN1566_c0_g1_i1.p1 TRINITY_DN1566_c0_g1~~TRINITY_DN1566_c0_g1_i1.p1  ORF type:complete len:390 (+),score=99.99 TRINITY_DN1566_c0_g1_i1:110-1279(+)